MKQKYKKTSLELFNDPEKLDLNIHIRIDLNGKVIMKKVWITKTEQRKNKMKIEWENEDN